MFVQSPIFPRLSHAIPFIPSAASGRDLGEDLVATPEARDLEFVFVHVDRETITAGADGACTADLIGCPDRENTIYQDYLVNVLRGLRYS